MPTVDHGALVDADPDRTWSVLRRFGEIATWHPAIAESRIEGDLPDGMPGCVRVLRLSDGRTLRERLLAMDEANHGLTYRFDEAPLPVDDYHLTVSVMPVTSEPRSFVRCEDGRNSLLMAWLGPGRVKTPGMGFALG
ncbi:SRPBCC family protein [Methylobacterium pseudosasicola]|uniref:Polyketide cyclase / dehydrase and lipid transport n=1 Tax=Methylobacterium pseudosasicola TaxID=582667 RepID=A0A1I4V967_9HYPH|nr:SRPBCC family protein [Methylobacterium pseudosasicola]SFM97701.1 Polyketide cyclase / dehydrase and lipid transport [Methylobacterium pseudosasicola]